MALKERIKFVPQHVMDAIKSSVTLDTVIKECTVRGKGEKIKSNAPKDGIFKYVWRYARFHNGDDATMPMMVIYDLSIQIEKTYGVNISFAILDDETRKELLRYLEDLSDQLIRKTGGDEFAAAKRWKGLLY